MTSSLFLFLNIGTSEMMLILFVALFLFGGKKLPELARGLGRGIREFKDASETIKRDINEQINNFEEDLGDLEVKEETKQIAQKSVEEESTDEMDTDADGVPYSEEYYPNYDYNYTEENLTGQEKTEEQASEEHVPTPSSSDEDESNPKED